MFISGYNFPNFIIKFGKKENLEKLQEGSIYMKDYWYYKKLEDEGMGDKYEGCEYSNQLARIKNDDGEDIVVPAFLYYEPNPENKVPIFCATWVNENNSTLRILKEQSIDEHRVYVGKLQVKIDVNRIIEDFDCDYGLILRYEEFQDRFVNHCKENNLEYEQGLVDYYDFSDFTNPWLKNKINAFDRFYRKRKCFEHQNEIRWVIDKVLIGVDNYTFNVGKFQTACILPIEKYKNLEIEAYCYKD